MTEQSQCYARRRIRLLPFALLCYSSDAFSPANPGRFVTVVPATQAAVQRRQVQPLYLETEASSQDGGGIEISVNGDDGATEMFSVTVDDILTGAQLAVSEPISLTSTPFNATQVATFVDDVSPDKDAAGMLTLEAPAVSKILTFAIPAIGVWLCNPLLSLIDTSAVGLLSGTAQLAALNPAAAVTNYAALLIAFMYTGTTNLVAAAQESDLGKPDRPKATHAFVTALQLSTWVGATLGTVLLVFARPLLMALIGNDAIAPDVFLAAMRYVRIRALGMPAATIIGSAQAGCLGLQDIKSPLYVLLAAAVVNFCGDAVLVGNSNPWIGGAAGAAWATVFSQYVALYLFTHWLCNKPSPPTKVADVATTIIEPTNDAKSDELRMGKSLKTVFQSLSKGKARPPKTPEKGFSCRGMLAQGRFVGMDYLKFPKKDDARQFQPYFLPVTSTQVGRVSSHIAMSHVVASCMGTVGMAAQQVVVSLFYCLTPISESLSLTAQSFVPIIYQKKPSKERSDALRLTALNFAKAGTVAGAVMMSIVMCIPYMSQLFSADPAVRVMVNSVTSLLLAFFCVHGVVAASEGVLMGQRDLPFLGKMYAGFFMVVPYLMLRVKKAALAGQYVDLTSVWSVFLSFQMFRVSAWVCRLLQLQRRTDRKVAVLTESGSI
jgi:Na+-driven multidrug efflux pump